MIRIGNTEIDSVALLAPLAGCTDLAFRTVARESGARFCFYEMIDAQCIVRNTAKSTELLRTSPDDRPIAAQLLGRDPAMMVDAAQKILAQRKPLFIDVNAACPVRKVVRRKVGAHLFRDTDALAKTVRALVGHLGVPVTVKMRVGYERRDPASAVEVARRCEESGASAVFVHGRCAADLYSGVVDYAAIRMIKEAVTIPVIGSGNVLSPYLAETMLQETGCDGILVARGALGNPWIFLQIDEYLKTGKYDAAVAFEARIRTLKRHLQCIEETIPGKRSSKAGKMRKVALWYLKAFPHAAQTRDAIGRARDLGQILDIIGRIESPAL